MGMDEKMREVLADIEHIRWSGWQEYLHSKCVKNIDGSLTIPSGYVFHLERLIKTPYDKLTEKEKDSDRAEANKNITALKSCMAEEIRGMKKEIPRIPFDKFLAMPEIQAEKVGYNEAIDDILRRFE